MQQASSYLFNSKTKTQLTIQIFSVDPLVDIYLHTNEYNIGI